MCVCVCVCVCAVCICCVCAYVVFVHVVFCMCVCVCVCVCMLCVCILCVCMLYMCMLCVSVCVNGHARTHIPIFEKSCARGELNNTVLTLTVLVRKNRLSIWCMLHIKVCAHCWMCSWMCLRAHTQTHTNLDSKKQQTETVHGIINMHLCRTCGVYTHYCVHAFTFVYTRFL